MLKFSKITFKITARRRRYPRVDRDQIGRGGCE